MSMRKLRIRLLLPFVFLLSMVTARCQTKFFTSFDDTKIAYTDEGEGKVVLLIHGFINTKESWQKTELKKQLLKEGFRVVALDLRGNGESDKPQTEEGYDFDAEVMDVMFLMQHLRQKKYMAIGYSRGSIVLAKLLLRDKRVKKAVLGGMGIDFTDYMWPRKIKFMKAFAGRVTEETKEAVAYAKSVGADFRSLYLQQRYQPYTRKSHLAYVKAKVLVIAGDGDTDNGSPEELHKAIPKSEFVIVEGDHNGTYKTKAFSEAVVSFLD
ncbi:Alpha/beta hydrolase-fold protein [Zobellia galactanivorans]|uniref:Alpha/beta hydrolase-fold protein n=2 Tax=Zobellia galactanivorans (strain DSM 12802 / CCUG 47099 / CIP 106680 / NCIMB 13871 / Dsij) TaxID=63186 RepID=G0LCX6_ZOBGA|nr:Alpha/beta hydrolase-fold protein [Zobellia galactanivorans]